MLPPKNLGLLFDWHAAKSHQTELFLDRPFDVAPDGGVDYNATQLAELVKEASGWLYAAGARRGDRIAVIKQNHFDMIILAAAAARIGAVAATISSANRPTHLAELLHKLEPALIVLSSFAFAGGYRQDIDLSGFGATVLLDADNDVPLGGTIALEQIRGAEAPELSLRPDDQPMMITHTSGTTSTPKLVVHTANSCRAGTRLEFLPLPFAVNGPRDISLSSISFAHSRAYAWANAQFRWAPKRLVIASSHAVSDVERVLDSQRPTTIEATPNVFQHWVPLVHPSIVRSFVEASERRNVLWGHSWGQSEVGPIAGGAYSRKKLDRLAGTPNDNMNTMGWAWPGLVQAKVVNPDTGVRVRRGQTGVFMVKAKSLCVDYLGETDRYDAKRSGDWWNTGDIGYKDTLGRIYFLDRAVDAIPGSSATELESVLLDRINGAIEVIVLTRGDGEPVPVVCVEGGTLTDEEWAEATLGLPPLESPVIIPWSDLPRTSTWKIRRKELREMVFAGRPDDTPLEERFT